MVQKVEAGWLHVPQRQHVVAFVLPVREKPFWSFLVYITTSLVRTKITTNWRRYISSSGLSSFVLHCGPDITVVYNG